MLAYYDRNPEFFELGPGYFIAFTKYHWQKCEYLDTFWDLYGYNYWCNPDNMNWHNDKYCRKSWELMWHCYIVFFCNSLVHAWFIMWYLNLNNRLMLLLLYHTDIKSFVYLKTYFLILLFIGLILPTSKQILAMFLPFNQNRPAIIQMLKIFLTFSIR